jgi:hypothetical protein
MARLDTMWTSAFTRSGRMHVKWGHVAAVLVGVCALTLAPGRAGAQVVNACVNNHNGKIRIPPNGTCNKHEHSVSLAGGGSAGGTLSIQQLNIVDASGNVLATFGSNNLGPLLSMVDAQGKKLLDLGIKPLSQPIQVGPGQFAQKGFGLAIFDGNSVLPGNGVLRTGIGASEFGAGTATYDVTGSKIMTSDSISQDGTSYGYAVLDGNGVARTGVDYYEPGKFTGFYLYDSQNRFRGAHGLYLDDSVSYADVYDANGSEYGMVDNPGFNYIGSYKNDLNHVNRGGEGLGLDGTYSNVYVIDPNGTSAGVTEDQNLNVASVWVQDALATQTNGSQGTGTFDVLGLDGSFHLLNVKNNGVNTILLEDSAGAGTIHTFTNGSPTGSVP